MDISEQSCTAGRAAPNAFSRFWLGSLILAAVSVAGCDGAPEASGPAKAQSPAVHLKVRQHALRVGLDNARNRVWVLGLDHVDVHDSRTNSLIRRIVLPPWSVADSVCPPDIAFDRSGTAFISHNVGPRLWQIDPDNFEVKEHSIRLLNREHLDIGFGKLVFASDGALFGVAASGGSLWRIDIHSASAHQVELDSAAFWNECALR